MENNTQQPRNVFEVINSNIVALSEDLNLMHKKIDEIHDVLYPRGEEQPLPNAGGDTVAGIN